jgi:hypothetical protein
VRGRLLAEEQDNIKQGGATPPMTMQGATMMTDMIATAPPVLAAGWALLYMLFGGGIGGAFLIFIALKAIGR